MVGGCARRGSILNITWFVFETNATCWIIPQPKSAGCINSNRDHTLECVFYNKKTERQHIARSVNQVWHLQRPWGGTRAAGLTRSTRLALATDLTFNQSRVAPPAVRRLAARERKTPPVSAKRQRGFPCAQKTTPRSFTSTVWRE